MKKDNIELGHLPPQAIDIEQAVLGASMLEADAFSAALELLQPESFYKPAHESIFRAMTRLAEKVFPGCIAADVTAGWQRFGEAFAWYPFSIPFLYFSPINYALAMTFSREPIHQQEAQRSWQMDPRDDCDNYSRCLGPFTSSEIVDRLAKVAAGWDEGLVLYERGLQGAQGKAQEECNVAQAIAVSLHSTTHFFQWSFAKSKSFYLYTDYF